MAIYQNMRDSIKIYSKEFIKNNNVLPIYFPFLGDPKNIKVSYITNNDNKVVLSKNFYTVSSNIATTNDFDNFGSLILKLSEKSSLSDLYLEMEINSSIYRNIDSQKKEYPIYLPIYNESALNVYILTPCNQKEQSQNK